MTLGAVFFRRALDSRGSPADFVGFAVAAFLVGATRRELALGPILYAGLGMLMGLNAASSERWRTAKALLVVAVLCGGTLTHIALYGRANAGFALSTAAFARHFGSVGAILFMVTLYNPLAVGAGIISLLVRAVRTRRPGPFAAYAAGLYLLTLPYAFSIDFARLLSPFESGASLRYALIWMILPIVASAYGWKYILASAFVRKMGIGARVGALVVLWVTSVPMYIFLSDFQLEYMFLREFQSRDAGREPIFVGWQKWAGTDLASSLAAPYHMLGGSNHEVHAFSYDTDWRRLLSAREDDALVFVNFLSLEPLDHDDPRDAASLSRTAYHGFRELRCLVEGNAVKVFGLEQARDVSPLDRWPHRTRMPELAIYRVPAQTDASRWAGCTESAE